jgi:hypothetical protein
MGILNICPPQYAYTRPRQLPRKDQNWAETHLTLHHSDIKAVGVSGQAVCTSHARRAGADDENALLALLRLLRHDEKRAGVRRKELRATMLARSPLKYWDEWQLGDEDRP